MLHATESQEQQALFEWAKHMEFRYPEIRYMYHVPNGGKRDIHTAKKLKAEGVKSGVPDICLPTPSGRYHGLYIELKAHGGTTTKNQNIWLEELANQGYCACVCVGWEQASDVILSYLRAKYGKKDTRTSHVNDENR